MNDQQMPTPAQVMLWLDAKAKELDELGKELEAWHVVAAEAELIYTDERDYWLRELFGDRITDGKRLPGEDARDAVIREQIDWDKFANHVLADAQVKALEGRIRRIEAAITARQTTLNTMRELDRMPAFDSNTDELIGGRR